MRETRILAVVTAVIGLAACGGHRGAELAPAESASTLAADSGRAVAKEGGIRLTVDPRAWGGNPADLEREVTPVQVTIQNQSGEPVRLSYADFALVARDGQRYQAMSPFRIDGSERAILTPMLGYDRFAVAPRYAPFYPGLEVWPDSITPAEKVTSDRWTTTWSDPLPTEDMLSLALPEGVLKPGGEVSGFLYFHRVDEDASRVKFKANFDNARSGSDVAAIAVPLVELDRRG